MVHAKAQRGKDAKEFLAETRRRRGGTGDRWFTQRRKEAKMRRNFSQRRRDAETQRRNKEQKSDK